ncbi:hypothetical protein MPH_08683 [Macrophomina phaseolina MS6]|uniref:Uncharacterized protein n=1 Tax=Macrophomina phaseolina (strain MS6) TaxID=1126212 RepID=K2RMW2_MACPH|nr:hypothetical protein MPH_08683 [Macrophomina phaseolina MS6]
MTQRPKTMACGRASEANAIHMCMWISCCRRHCSRCDRCACRSAPGACSGTARRMQHHQTPSAIQSARNGNLKRAGPTVGNTREAGNRLRVCAPPNPETECSAFPSQQHTSRVLSLPQGAGLRADPNKEKQSAPGLAKTSNQACRHIRARQQRYVTQ